MRKYLVTIILSIAAFLSIGIAALAAFSAVISVTNNSSTAYPMIGMNQSANTTYMAANGYFDNTEGLDTRVYSGVSTVPHMLVSDRIMWAAPIPANSSPQFTFTTNNSALTTFSIIPGYGGFITTDDDASLEQADNFTDRFNGHFDATASGDILDKPAAFNVAADGSGNITARTSGSLGLVSSSSTGNSSVAASTVNLSMPSGIAANDLLIVHINGFTGSGAPVIYPAPDWVELWSSVSMAANNEYAGFYKIADGTETATSENFSFSGSSTFIYQVLRIDESLYLGTPVAGTGAVDAGSSNPDPPSVTSGFGTVETLWLTTMVATNTTVTGAPAQYTGLLASEDVPLGLYAASAYLEKTAASENPGVFTPTQNNWASNTIAIRSAATITASNIASGERAVVVDLGGDRPALTSWSSSANVLANFGGGQLPVFVLAETELSAAAANVTFTGIDTAVTTYNTITGQTARHLVILYNAASDSAVTEREVYMQLNGDTGANYNFQALSGVAAAASAGRTTGATFSRVGYIPGTSVANSYAGNIIIFPHGFNTANHKAYLVYGGAGEYIVQASAHRWADNSAITSALLYPAAGNFVSGSTFQIGVVDERFNIGEATPNSENVTFSGIAGTGNNLVAIGYGKSDRAANFDTIFNTFNSDTTNANYNRQLLNGASSSTGAQQNNSRNIGIFPGATAGANEFGAFVAFINQYAEAANHPSTLSISGVHTSVPYSDVDINSGRWSNANAITSVGYSTEAGTGFVNGSRFDLYRVPQYLIERVVLTSTANVTFSNIPQTYEALQLNCYCRTDFAGTSDNVTVSYNSDTTAANYDYQRLSGQTSTPSAQRDSASRILMTVTAAGEGANEFGGGLATISQYAETDRHKHAFVIDGTNENRVNLRSTRWENLNGVTTITLAPVNGTGFVSGSIIELTGLMPSRTFSITVDGTVEGIAAAAASSVPDNANDYTWITGNVFPYSDNLSIDINGTNVLLYSPNAIIQGVTLPDRSGNGNDGAFTFGANPFAVSMSSLQTDETITSVTGLETPDVVPDYTQPEYVIDATRLACISSSDPILYPIMSAINTVTGLSILAAYWMFFMMIAFIVFARIYTLVPNLMLASVGLGAVIGFATAWPLGCGIYDWPVLAITVVILAGLNIMSGRQPA